MNFPPNLHKQKAVALVVVLAMVVVLTGIVITTMMVVSGERRATGQRVQGVAASQLAASAPQIVMTQIRDATTSAGTWASQPGMIRTFNNQGQANQIFKLYSAAAMVVGGAGFVEDQDTPPGDWNSGRNSAIYSDLNRPQRRGGGGFVFPIADPGPAATAFGGDTSFNGESPIPGYAIASDSVPGFDPGQPPAPDNNPLPMPVRWLYVLENGEMAIPQSVNAEGIVTFSGDGATPSGNNPVVGRLAFWTDDETAKVNVNTAGYARNDDDYWTYWDTPVIFTRDENMKLSYGQPWTNEFQRYPGHPATTGLNVVFDSLNLTDEQILALTPRFIAGGTLGASTGRRTPPSRDEVNALVKNERLFASIDEMFYDPERGANAAGIREEDLEARRFLLTANSRAPEVTLFNTPRVTIWPTWRQPERRTPLDRLIAFTSTIADQQFFFVRDDPMARNELLGFAENLSLWNYLRTLASENIPGFGGNFETKYGSDTTNQIVTSMFDAIRLTNLDDRSGAVNAAGAPIDSWSFNARRTNWRPEFGRWMPPHATQYTAGYVAPTEGPHDTRAPGRVPVLAEAVFLLARPTNSAADIHDPRFPIPADPANRRNIPEHDIAVGTLFLGFVTPSAGMIQPGQNRRVVVRGLEQFQVRTDALDSHGDPVDWQRIIPSNVWDYSENDGREVTRRFMGGRMEFTSTRKVGVPPPSIPPGEPSELTQLRLLVPDLGAGGNGVPESGILVLPINMANPDDVPIRFSGGTLTVEVFTPANAPEPFHVYQIVFPPCDALTPEAPRGGGNSLTRNRSSALSTQHHWRADSRFTNNGYEERITSLGDTLLAMQSQTGDFGYENLLPSSPENPITNFRPHRRYGRTDILPLSISTGVASTSPTLLGGASMEWLSRRASSMRWSISNGWATNYEVRPQLYDVLLGRMIEGFNDYTKMLNPFVPALEDAGGNTISIQAAFPPGDFSNGPGIVNDGAHSAKADEGARMTSLLESPYFHNVNISTYERDGTLSSPNRQISSAVYFGSINSGTPWRTLLFRPARPFHSGGTSHFGTSSPPDYLMLDWFHMPVVEPYAISEPFSTAGKINLNSHIMPFGSYVRRDTGLHAVLESVRVAGIPENLVGLRDVSRIIPAGWNYVDDSSVPDVQTRFPLDVLETMSLIRDRFAGTDGSGKRIYLTNAEICTIDLVPEGFTRNNLATFWADKRVTGDNSREAPYSSLLPRLTARSNSYSVHVVAQSLKTSREDGGWQEGWDRVVSEWRGTFEIERYIDPNDSRFAGDEAPDFLSGSTSVEPYYRFRILGEERFDP